jgi:hypothetical protein
VAESVLNAIVDSLTLHGYQVAEDPQIWCLHLQAQLRGSTASGAAIWGLPVSS